MQCHTQSGNLSYEQYSSGKIGNGKCIQNTYYKSLWYWFSQGLKFYRRCAKDNFDQQWFLLRLYRKTFISLGSTMKNYMFILSFNLAFTIRKLQYLALRDCRLMPSHRTNGVLCKTTCKWSKPLDILLIQARLYQDSHSAGRHVCSKVEHLLMNIVVGTLSRPDGFIYYSRVDVGAKSCKLAMFQNTSWKWLATSTTTVSRPLWNSQWKWCFSISMLC